MTPQEPTYKLRCIESGDTYPGNEIRYRSEKGGLLEAQHDFSKLSITRQLLDERFHSQEFPYRSGVWRYHEFVLPVAKEHIITRYEGNTNLYPVGSENARERNYSTIVGDFAGARNLYLKHLGENPTGSFKDLGMTAGITQAKALGCKAVACASTGNTSAALASYASLAGMQSYVFIPEGNIAYGKLSQALAYGSKTIQIKGDFDDAMRLVQEICREEHIYLLNSINPFRLEGQKTVAFEIIQQLGWNPPDWIVVPAGNLGNTSAIWKGLREFHQLGFINKIPRIASIQAAGSNPFYQSYKNNFSTFEAVKADTIASAIKIGNPVSIPKAIDAIRKSNGVVEQVTDQEIMDAKAKIDALGIGCEPASACAVAGTKKLIEQGIIGKDEVVVGILTGNILKDPDATVNYHLGKLSEIKGTFANQPVQTDATVESIKKYL
ncbi:MAG: threonine synthase [bacterium]